MIEVANQFAGASLIYQTSTDGLTWNAAITLEAAGIFAAGANNPGISGDSEGNLIAGQTLIAYGAPYEPAPVSAAMGMAGGSHN